MQTLKKGKLKLSLSIVLLLLAVAVFLYVLRGTDINMAAVGNALIYAELPLAMGILLLILAIIDIKEGRKERHYFF